MATGKTVHGIKGPTPLLELEDLDIIRGTVPDYLHSVCHGGIRFFLHLWTDESSHKEPWYLNKQRRSILDARLGQMKPPYDVTRTCRPISEINLWKASESGLLRCTISQHWKTCFPKCIIDISRASGESHNGVNLESRIHGHPLDWRSKESH